MRRLQFSIRPRHWPWLDRRKTEFSIFIRWNSSVALEAGLYRFILRVVGMSVFSVGIRLPQFDDRVRHAHTVGIEYPPRDRHALARNAGTRELRAVQMVQTDAEERADGL